MQAQNIAPSGYPALIARATGAPAEILPTLEDIMRAEIFHSTLDWQTAGQLQEGARKALDLYRANQAFYDANARWTRALCRVALAERSVQALRERKETQECLATALTELEAARFEEAAARISFSEVSTT